MPLHDRLAPQARPLVDAMAAFFPDLGGAVTDAAEARRILSAAPEKPFPAPVVGAVEDRAIPGPAGAPPIPVRIYRPDDSAPGPVPVVVFFHGGGWVICDLDSHDSTARALCRDAGAVVVSVDYRLAPEHRFPAAVEDAYAALCWVAGHAAELGADAGALSVAGDSAGGNLAAVVAQIARDEDGPAVARQILVYPATDVRQKTGSFDANADGYFLTAAHCAWFREQYLGPDGDPAHPHVSPLLAERLDGLPAAHVVTAGCDPLCDEGRAYAQALKDAGVPVTESSFPGMFHGFFGFPELLEDARRALADVVEVIVSSRRDRKNDGDHGGGAG
ncbi:alpha/beta hydrolase [Streptomyces sp. VRA16 Mangrove soil]|uniref:alpha/beta hydrolase n=1 Tax=Streptomyces sp. VRA16 Mangrove soil TaxID=2817434 RepID=UPI001A9CF081|nr:alpha/beta hydrolase [Streptomyces sp. VRA16 Mangrove soil]MBO1330217.1 alpha/beta hydrolase [Streptomyces sp. VRA16 Mangrove soil]